jgi:hypothetical protein
MIEQQPVPGIVRDGSTPAATSSSSSIARSSIDSEFASLFVPKTASPQFCDSNHLQCAMKPYQIKGSPFFDTLTYKPVNDRTNKTTATKAGKVVMTGTITVAKDGKSRVVRLTGTDANGQKFTDMTYYDKQH